jgi:hypothetical protein
MTQKFGNKVLNFSMSRDVFSFEATSDAIYEVIRTLKTEEDLGFFQKYQFQVLQKKKLY